MHLGVDFILEALAREGLDHVFMVPGGLVDPFLPAFGRQEALTPIVAAQEGGAAYMADGYARASGNFGAALCIGGPGLTNTVTAVATAQSDGSPLLLMSGEVATVLEGLGVFQDASPQTLDDVAIMKPLTRYSSSIDNPKNMPHLFEHALLQLRTRPAAPVHLSLPGDCLAAEISVTHTPIDRALIDYNALSMAAAELSLQHFLALRRRQAARQDRHIGRRGRRALESRPCAEGIRRDLAHSGRDDAARKGRLPRGPSAFARRVRLCGDAPFPRRVDGPLARSADHFGVGTERARHDALGAPSQTQ